MKVLIAEDDESCARLLKFVLQKAGYEIEVASDGKEALARLQRKNGPKLAILDWMMPGMSGLDVCSTLRASDEETRTYIMLLTAKTHSKDIAKALDSGADDYIKKPYDTRELLARLRVAERTVKLQYQLHDQIITLESLLRRHNLLGEMFRKRGERSGEEDALTLEINHIFAKTFKDIGLNLDAQKSSDEIVEVKPDWMAWSALAIKSTSQWYDMMIWVSRESGRALCQKMVGSSENSDQKLMDILAEMLNLAQSHVMRTFERRKMQVLAPFLSRPFEVDNLIDFERPIQNSNLYRFVSGDFCLDLEVSKHSAPIIDKPLRSLENLDILANPIYRPIPKNQILLNEGVVVNDYYLHKLGEFRLLWVENKEVSVIQPSPVSRSLMGANGQEIQNIQSKTPNTIVQD